MSTVPALHTTRLTKRFPSTLAVDELSLTVPPGEIFGFLGPNGAGKSTTIRLLLGLLRPSSGTAEVFGDAAGDVERAHRHLSYVPADVALWPSLTGQECLNLLAGVGPGTDLAYRDELLERFELEPDRRARTYSSGNRQKVALVAAFATRAPLLVLDEPTSGLDPLMEREFRRCIGEAAERGQTVFLSSAPTGRGRGGLLPGRHPPPWPARRGRGPGGAAPAPAVGGRRRPGPPAPELQRLAELPGVADLRWLTDHQLTLSLVGPPGPVLGALADADVARLDVREPSLEEIFLDYYGEVPA